MKVVQENEVDGSDFGEPFNDVTKLAEGDRGAQRGSVDAIGALPTRQFDRDQFGRSFPVVVPRYDDW